MIACEWTTDWTQQSLSIIRKNPLLSNIWCIKSEGGSGNGAGIYSVKALMHCIASHITFLFLHEKKKRERKDQPAWMTTAQRHLTLLWWKCLSNQPSISSAPLYPVHWTQYSPKNSIDILSTTQSHQDKKGHYVRLMVTDYSSALHQSSIQDEPGIKPLTVYVDRWLSSWWGISEGYLCAGPMYPEPSTWS